MVYTACMQRICKQCDASFEITDIDLAFYETISPEFGGEKYPIPAPTLCPICRMIRRLLFRNERHLYHRTSDLSGKPIVSTVAPGKRYTIYDQDEWWSDQWDGKGYGRKFDTGRSFIEQVHELNQEVPHPSLSTTNVENSAYTNYSLNVRNSYLVFGVTNAEDCMYGKFVITCKDCVDCLSIFSSERCYEGVAASRCYNCAYFSYCQNCSDCFLVEDCIGCKNCILCLGLQQQEYCIFNEKLDRETYEKRKDELLKNLTVQKIRELREQSQEFKRDKPRRASHLFACEDCSGDMLTNCKNCHSCFDMTDSENCRYAAFMPKGLFAYDANFGSPTGMQWCLEMCCSMGQYCMGNYLCWDCNYTYYSIDCKNCKNCFGCVGLKNQEYCILNTQCTPEEYSNIVQSIISAMQKAGEWGEYLPPFVSQFSYNESLAQEYFPLSHGDAVAQGWEWRDEKEAALPPNSITVDQLPRTIDDVTDDVLRSPVICEKTGIPFNFVKQELAFYRSMALPLPHLHPDERSADRLRRKNSYRLWERQCNHCDKNIQSNYSPDRPEIVYCESCYLKTIY